MPGSKQGETKADPQLRTGEAPLRWLEAVAGMAGPAPVDQWHPAHCGAIDIRIDRDGNWHHEGRRIEREALVRLFSRILRREADGSFVLVTPAEKLAIEVEDVPFLAVDIDLSGEGTGRVLRFLTNLGEVVPLDAAHPLRVEGGEAFIPYVTVRPGLEARLTRSAAAEFASLGEMREDRFGVRSSGQFFVIADTGNGWN